MLSLVFHSRFIADPVGIFASFLLHETTVSLSFTVLAAWFRLKYPHVAIGALASSAPILQFDDITPWSSFYDAVSQDFKVCKLSPYPLVCWSWVIYVSSVLFPHFLKLFFGVWLFPLWKNFQWIWAGSELELLWGDKGKLGRAGRHIS